MAWLLLPCWLPGRRRERRAALFFPCFNRSRSAHEYCRLHEVGPMVPDEVEPAMPIIWTADELIEEATRRLADLNRKLAKLQRSRSRTSASVKLARNTARVELLELIELAEIGT
jgi:hypothetical protein